MMLKLRTGRARQPVDSKRHSFLKSILKMGSRKKVFFNTTAMKGKVGNLHGLLCSFLDQISKIEMALGDSSIHVLTYLKLMTYCKEGSIRTHRATCPGCAHPQLYLQLRSIRSIRHEILRQPIWDLQDSLRDSVDDGLNCYFPITIQLVLHANKL